MSPPEEARLRAWLEYVADTAIEMLDALDAAMSDHEPDGEDEVVCAEDTGRRLRA